MLIAVSIAIEIETEIEKGGPDQSGLNGVMPQYEGV